MDRQANVGGTAGNGWRLALWGGAAALLGLPAAAMHVTREVAWTAGDFAVFGAMLLVACGLCELAMARLRRRRARIAAVAAVGLAFGLLWADLAVGLFH
ncbi:hypothetical protein [Pseudoxanthomonas sp. 10H]|uniref:hypothetical protein n=1 Tax=Pseudoxanthomonas sp. 10H TaxID=3242729 RepID=UPI003557E4A4